MNSILTSVKQKLGITEEYTQFDTEIIDHINNAFADLMQMGIGECKVFVIQDKSAVWSDFIAEDLWYAPMVPSYVASKVRLRFDPPTSSSHTEALKETIDETGWRLQMAADKTDMPGSSGSSSASTEGTDDYTKLKNLPSINGETLIGNYNEKDPTMQEAVGDMDAALEAIKDIQENLIGGDS